MTDDVISRRPVQWLYGVRRSVPDVSWFSGCFQGRPAHRKRFRPYHVTGDVTFPTFRPPNRKCSYIANYGDRIEIPKTFQEFSGRPTQRKCFQNCHVTIDVILEAGKPEMDVSPVVGGLDAKFQMFFGGFQGRSTHWKWFRSCHMTADVTFPTWRPPNRKCNYICSCDDGNEIPNTA